MKTSLRILAGATALVAGCLSLSACDGSPYAVSVNGHVIKQTAFNSYLEQWDSNKAFVTSEDQAAAQGSTSGATPVTGAGGPGTYTIAFAASRLGYLIEESVVHQTLAATGSLPGADLVAAARGLEEGEAAMQNDQTWYGFPESLRQFLATLLAEEAAVIQPSTDTSTLQQAYAQLAPYMYTQLCVLQATAFTPTQATAIAASGVAQGAKLCYDQAQLEGQAPAYRTAVLGLAVGHVSQSIPTSYGSVIVKLLSKQTVPNDADTQKFLTLITDQSIPAQLADLLARAHVQVNPAYGTWDGKSGVVTPPSAPNVKTS